MALAPGGDQRHPDEWRVEEYEADDDAGVAVAIFTALVQNPAPAATPSSFESGTV